MKPLVVAEDIVPMAEFKANASRMMRNLREGHRPVVITHNGRPAGVLVSPEDYDRLREHDRFMDAVKEGLADIAAGRSIADEDLFPDDPA